MNMARLPMLWKLSAGEIRRRPGRTSLTLLGIVIGVAATVAISITVQTARRVHRDMFEALTGRASLEVVAEGFGGFPADLARSLQNTPHVEAVVPVIQTPAAALGKSGPVPVLVLGINPDVDTAARDYRLRLGRMLVQDDTVLLEAGFAESQGFKLGEPVRFLTPTGPASLEVRGFLEPHGPAAFNGGAVAFMTLTTAQRLFDLPHQVNSLQLVLSNDAVLPDTQGQIEKLLRPGLTIQSPGARGDLGRDGMMSTEQGLASLSVSSLVAGAFVILNAFLMNLGERRRQLAILRAIGATSRQVSRLLLREALLLGITGTLIGIPVGMLLAVALRQVLAQLLAVTLPAIRWDAEPFAIAVALGPGMAVAATYFPARRAGQRSPLEDLLQKKADRAEHVRLWPAYLGVVMLGCVVLFALGIVRGWLPVRIVTHLQAPTLAAFLTSCVLVVPLFQMPLTRMAAAILRPIFGGEGGLAFRQLARHRTRTALTAGVLLVAIVFAIGFGQSLMNNMRHLNDWFQTIVKADYFVRGSWPDPTVNITTAAIPESTVAEIAALPGVAYVDYINFLPVRVDGRTAAVIAYSVAEDRPVSLALEEGNPDTVRRGLKSGHVVLGTALAHRLGRRVGDTVQIETRQGSKEFVIAGTASEYTGGGMAFYMEWHTAQRAFDLQGVHAILATARTGARDELGMRLREFTQKHGLLLQTNAQVHQTLGKQLQGFLGFLWVLLSLVFVVASLGVVNTLTMNVMEQTREFGVLRAIGMKRRQIGKLILTQALALGIISLAPGVVAGVALAYLVNLVTYPLIGHAVPFELSAWHVAGCFGTALAIAVAAALLPARRAARLGVVQALQYE
jgi:putative ABC transport system permease protein